jgi:hypothetical protein
LSGDCHATRSRERALRILFPSSILDPESREPGVGVDLLKYFTAPLASYQRGCRITWITVTNIITVKMRLNIPKSVLTSEHKNFMK